MTDKITVLKSFNTERLIDVVKNYKQYGYDNNLRNAALGILEERGIDEEQLKLAGNFENETYNTAEKIYNSFKQNSIIAFIFYIITFICAIFLPIFTIDSELLTQITLLIGLIAVLLYFIFFIRSFIRQIEFFKVLGEHLGSRTIAIYFVLGIPFFVFLYFYYKNKISEEMKLIK